MGEKKTYDRTYVVNISTEEYRELIDERATFRCESESYRADYYKALNEIKMKNLEIDSLKDEINHLKALADELTKLIPSDVFDEEAPNA